MDTHSCPACARPRTPADAAGLAWSSQHEPDGRTSWICPDCTREQLWRIEALLGVERIAAPAAGVLPAA
jgi:ribosomal protein L37AE/L43A